MFPLPGLVVDVCELEARVPLLLKQETEIPFSPQLSELSGTLKPGILDVILYDPKRPPLGPFHYFKEIEDKKSSIQKIQITTHRLIFQSQDLYRNVVKANIRKKIVINPDDGILSSLGDAVYDIPSDYFSIRLDRIRQIGLQGTGIVRNQRMAFNYVYDITNPSIVNECLFYFNRKEHINPLLQFLQVQTINKRYWLQMNPTYEKQVIMGGLSAIQHAHNTRLRTEKNTADEGLADLAGLQKNAELLIKLAKKVCNSSGAEDNEIKKLLKEYGLLNIGEESANIGASSGASIPASNLASSLTKENENQSSDDSGKGGDVGGVVSPLRNLGFSSGSSGTGSSGSSTPSLSGVQRVQPRIVDNIDQLMAQSIGGKLNLSPRGTAICKELEPITMKALRSTVAGTMMLQDLFCLFNRCRGTDLVSPQEFVSAVNRITEASKALKEELNRQNKLQLYKGDQSVHVTRLNNGALVVQLDSMSPSRLGEKMLELIKKREKETKIAYLTAEYLSDEWNITYGLAAGQLRQVELLSQSPICRDDTVRGLRFYKNIFI